MLRGCVVKLQSSSYTKKQILFLFCLRNQTKNTIFAARFFIDFYLWELIVFSCRQSVRITGSFCLWLFRVPASSAYSQRHLLAVFLALARYIVHSLRKLFPNVLLSVSQKNAIFAVPIMKHYKNQNPKWLKIRHIKKLVTENS